VDRDFKVYSFQAFRFSVTHAEQLKQANILVAIGDDDDAISPTLKVASRARHRAFGRV
jgi:hypothetical protein